MLPRSRREMLLDVGQGMFVAGLGVGVASDLALANVRDDAPQSLSFGKLDPLVAFVRETPANQIVPRAIEKLRAGTPLKTLVAAAALANAQAFGGEDYVGFHTLMALVPSYQMAMEESDERLRPLAVLKVLYRNAARLGEVGATAEVLRPVKSGGGTRNLPDGARLRDEVRRANVDEAEATFAALARNSPREALDQLLVMVDDATEVHRVVLVSRAWDLLDFVGAEQAHAMLRQSVRYCVKSEKHPAHAKHFAEVRELLPKLLDRLEGKPVGTRTADDAWVEAFANTLFRATAKQAAEAVAEALAEGFTPNSIAEAISLTANQLALRDEGRPAGQTSATKPLGSCHGDSIGVHACDSAHAWRNLARIGNRRTTVSSLILGGYQVARDRAERGGDFLNWQPYPRTDHREKVRNLPVESLRKELDGAIREGNQSRAAALAHRMADGSAREAFDAMRAFAVSEDGALHAEKFFRTSSDEYAASRPAYRGRQLVALARVTASAFGQSAPGVKEARERLAT